jgi:ribosomal protein S18 acetylase RimI-like enzyme
MTDLRIRTAKPGDAAEIAEIGARTFRATYEAHNTPQNMAAYVAESFSPETILNELADPESAFLLAARGDANVGFAKVRRSEVPECVDGPNPIELERIYVDAGQQGGGIGASLLHAVIDYARNEGCGTVWLGVWERNTAARGFYENQGFRSVGHKTFAVGNEVQNDLVMSRRLDQAK